LGVFGRRFGASMPMRRIIVTTMARLIATPPPRSGLRYDLGGGNGGVTIA